MGEKEYLLIGIASIALFLFLFLFVSVVSPIIIWYRNMPD
jgi:hypothetical protein